MKPTDNNNDEDALTENIAFRAKKKEKERLKLVQENIRIGDPRGRDVEISEILRSILGWANRQLVTDEERAFIAGDIPALHGPFVKGRKKP